MDEWIKYLVAFILGYLLHKMTQGNGFSIDIADDVCPKHISDFIKNRNNPPYIWPDLSQVLNPGERLQGICAMKKGDTRYNSNSASNCRKEDTMTWCNFYPKDNVFSKDSVYNVSGAKINIDEIELNMNGTYTLQNKNSCGMNPVYRNSNGYYLWMQGPPWPAVSAEGGLDARVGFQPAGQVEGIWAIGRMYCGNHYCHPGDKLECLLSKSDATSNPYIGMRYDGKMNYLTTKPDTPAKWDWQGMQGIIKHAPDIKVTKIN